MNASDAGNRAGMARTLPALRFSTAVYRLRAIYGDLGPAEHDLP